MQALGEAEARNREAAERYRGAASGELRVVH